MRVFSHEGMINASLEDVWGFHSGVNGLTEVSPEWMNLRIESSETHQPFRVGDRVSISINPPGLPKIGWTSVITEVDLGDANAMFVDRMEDGPFPTWIHTHMFKSVGDGTMMRDRVEYSLPWWMLGWLGEPVFGALLEFVFRYRYKRTQELVNGGRS